MTTLMLWETNESLVPPDPEEQKKFHMGNLERIKEGIKTGRLIMWGISPGGGNGYAITEAEGKELLAMTSMWSPYVKFTIKPMLSADEAIEAMNIQP